MKQWLVKKRKVTTLDRVEVMQLMKTMKTSWLSWLEWWHGEGEQHRSKAEEGSGPGESARGRWGRAPLSWR